MAAKGAAGGGGAAGGRAPRGASGMRRAADLGPADWAAIERDYADPAQSVRSIERRHRVHHKAIYARAKAEGWPPRRETEPTIGPERRLHARLRRLIERALDEAERSGLAAEEGRALAGLLEKLVRVAGRVAELERRSAADAGKGEGRRRAPLDAAGRAAVEDFLARHGVVLGPVAGWGGRGARAEDAPAG